MRGYDSTSYGDGFADVYDEWYGDVTDVAATVARLMALAGAGGAVLELGVGTGRLAVPMAEAGLNVTGIDSSEAMLAKLRQRSSTARDVAVNASGAGSVEVVSDEPIRAPAAGSVEVVAGDMVADMPAGPFAAVLVAYNTIFNLLDPAAQARCFEAVASRLIAGGSFVVEAFVPDADGREESNVTVRSLDVDRVVLSVSQNDPVGQRANGQFIEITESGGVRLRPWAVRWSTVQQLDAMAAAAGLTVAERTEDMAGHPFTPDSSTHVTIYKKPADKSRRGQTPA